MKKSNKTDMKNSAKTNYSCNNNNNNSASKNSAQKTNKSLETNSNSNARSYDFEQFLPKKEAIQLLFNFKMQND